MWPPRNPCRLAFALCLVLVPAAPARAFEFAPVRPVPRPGDQYIPLDMFAGVAVGFDSNVGRSTAAAEEGDTVAEYLAGVALARRGTRGAFNLSAETRAERYADLTDLNFEESVLKGGVRWSGGKLRASLGGSQASLADPVDAETIGLGLQERTEQEWVPLVGLGLGGTELSVGYGYRSVDYEADRFRHLNHEDSSLHLRFDLLMRAKTRRLFVAWSKADLDYEKDIVRADLERGRIYAGWQSESARRSNFEACLGGYTIRGAGVSDEGGLFMKVRTTVLMDQGHSALEFAFQRAAEPAAAADFKTASRILVRYSRKTDKRRRWSTQYRSEISDYSNPDDPIRGSLSLHVLDAGFERRLGSQGRWRGRSFVKIGIELGGGSSPDDRFDRLRVLAGLAVVR